MRSFAPALLLSLAAAAASSGQVVISQVDGNGGLNIHPFDRDFVELFNRGSTPVDLSGWSLQLWGDTGNATTQATPSWDVIPLSGVILPGQYFLVAPSFQRGSLGASVLTQPLPAPDVMGPVYDGAILVGAINGAALMSTTTQIAAGSCPNTRPDLVDLFRYGHPNALCFEGSAPSFPVVPVSGLTTVSRQSGGCQDIDDNLFDLESGVFPAPRNSDVNVFVSTTASPNVVVNGAGAIVRITATRGTSFCNPLPAGNLTAATANLSAFGLSASQALFDNGTNGDQFPGDGVYSYEFAVSAAQAAGNYVIPITGTSGAASLPSSARVRVFPAAPANDNCANAIVLSDAAPGGVNIFTGGAFQTLVNTRDATSDGIDAGTCNGDTEVKYSVWYTFTAPVSGAVRVSENSTEDIVTSIYTVCGAASSVCLNREDVGFPVSAGTTYFLQIGRETGNGDLPQAPLDLTFSYVPPVANDSPCGAQAIASFPFTDQPYGPAASDDPFNISCDAAANPGARNGVWYTFTPAVNGVIEFFEGSINPSNLTVFTGADCGSLVMGQCIDESLSGAILPGLTGGTTYWLLLSYDAAATTSTTNQPYNPTINFLPAPVNDLCDGAVDLNSVGLPFAETIRARAAGNDAGVPTSTGGAGFNTCNATLGTRLNGVWYTYTAGPDANGTLRVADTSTQDVFYNVFTGSCGGGLTPVQCYGAFTADDIHIALTPSTTYYILVGMQSTTLPAGGDYNLTFTLHPIPANDTPCGATFVASALTESVTGPSATADQDVSCNYTNPAQFTTGYGVWYRFAPETAKLLFVRNTASDVLVYGLWTGPNCNALSESVCRMGSNSPLSDNFAYFELQGGTEYWLLAGKIANSQPFGAYNLVIELREPNGACCTAAGCTITTAADCSGNFQGAFTYCGSEPNYSETVELPIPDATSGAGGTPGVLTRTINVPDSGTVSDLKVLVDLGHGRVGDLIITITGPSGATSDLIRRIDDTRGGCPNFGSQGRLTDMGGVYIFDDQSYNPYGPAMPDAAAYFDFTGLVVLPGRYQPTTCNDLVINLNSAFLGSSITGDWTLTITDNQAAGSTAGQAVLHNWGLFINNGANNPCDAPACRADFNNDTFINPDDLADFITCFFLDIQFPGFCPQADFNGDTSRDPDDLADFITTFFLAVQFGC